jgi:hypothetical protein
MKTLKTLINDYNRSTYALADGLTNSNKSRKDLVEMTGLPVAKVNWLKRLASVSFRDGLLPELAYECSHTTDSTAWMKKAKEEKLNVIQLRQQIRDSIKTVSQNKKATNLPTWPKHILLAVNEISRTKNINKDSVNQLIQKLQSVVDAK